MPRIYAGVQSLASAFSPSIRCGHEQTAERDKAKSDNPVKAMKFDRLFVRHWTPGGRQAEPHLCIAGEAGSTNGLETAGEPIDLMKESMPIARPSHLAAGEFAWSPDGKGLLTQPALRWHRLSTDSISIRSRCRRRGQSITVANKATDTGPVYSPMADVAIAPCPAGFESDRYRTRSRPRQRQNAHVDEAWDRSPVARMVAGCKTLLAAASDQLAKDLSMDATTDSLRPSSATIQQRRDLRGRCGRKRHPRIAFAQDSLTAQPKSSCESRRVRCQTAHALNDER